MWLIAVVLCAQVRFPELPEVLPQPVPRPIAELKADQWYVIESAEPVVVIGSPDGRVTITADVGPMRMKGLFVDGSRIETRTYSSPYIYTVEAASNGAVELLVIPSEVKTADDVIRKTLVVSGVGPQPPPDPDDQDPPKPPIPADAKRVLILYESAEMSRYPQSQVNQFTSATLREYLRTHCSTGPVNGTPEFRIWDKDTDISNAPQAWKDAMALPRGDLPQLIVSNGVEGFSGPLPATEAETLAILRKYLGD